MAYIWILLALFIAVFIALFQYGYIFSKKRHSSTKLWLAILRAATVFCVLLLIIAPQFDQTSYKNEKPLLLVLADQSNSIDHLNLSNDLARDFNSLTNDAQLTDRFDVKTFAFSDVLSPLDSMQFEGKHTDIYHALEQSTSLFKNRQKAIVILTDGNQTLGSAYKYFDTPQKTQLFPIIYGDTLTYTDLKIDLINTNKYSYLNNEFPVEIFVSYSGVESLTTELKVTRKGSVIHKQNINFSSSNTSRTVSFRTKSTAVGLQSYAVELKAVDNEKNTVNNKGKFVVEVIDQRTKVLMLSNKMHPDLGALKKAIESNEYREVVIANTTEVVDYNSFDLVILVDPDGAFAKAYKEIQLLEKNTWLIAGPQTDWTMINSSQKAFTVANDPEFDLVQPILNTSYPSYDISGFDFNNYPPVKVPFGLVEFEQLSQILMYKQIGEVQTEQPLWFTYEEGSNRHAVLLASGLWRWRAQAYLDQKDFANWDQLVSSTIQYLASKGRRDRLELIYENSFNQNDKITIGARVLDKNFLFDNDAVVNLKLVHAITGDTQTRPLVINQQQYTANLNGLAPGEYKFTVRVKNQELVKSGTFIVFEYNPEHAQYSANLADFKNLVDRDDIFYSGQVDQLKKRLLNLPEFKIVERAVIKKQSLIDLNYLFLILIILLSIEWFARKYKGMV